MYKRQVVSNAGYGLFGCAEELSDDEINHIIATNLTGSIQLIKTSLPYLRKQGGGRIIQLSDVYKRQAVHLMYRFDTTHQSQIQGICLQECLRCV